ncbi:hypothetical protein, partial [Faecalibaculum rodentium]
RNNWLQLSFTELRSLSSFKKLYPSKNHRLGAFLMFCSLQKLEHFLERFSERCFGMTVNETTIKHA